MKIKMKKIKEKDKVIFAKLLIKITFVMVCISSAIKLLGFNIFNANHSNQILSFISKFIYKYQLLHIVNFLLLIIQTYIFLKIACKNSNKKVYYIATVVLSLICIITQTQYISKYFTNSQLGDIFYFIFSFLMLIIPSIIIDIKIKYKQKKNRLLLFRIIVEIWNRIKRPIILFTILAVYQALVMFLRNITVHIDRHDYVYNFLLNFDYIILLIATYYVFIKKENNLELKSESSFSLINLFHNRPSIEEFKLMVKGFKEKLEEFKTKDKEDRLVFILYVSFFIITEFVNLGLIIFIANLNNYLTECIFIIIAFLVSRKVFGAFHFKSAITCFVVSNIAFFILNKITLNTDVSFVVPISLGLALSLGTSLLIKRTSKSLYRGMSKSELDAICKGKKLTDMELKILEDFYCNKMSMIQITIKYSYSDSTIYRFKTSAIKKLELYN